MAAEGRQRIEAFDYMKAIAILLVVRTHFGSHVAELEADPAHSISTHFTAFVNGSWETSVMIFLMVSGALCWYNHPGVEKKEIPAYYRKRLKALFPSFYIVWFIGFLENVLAAKQVFYVKPAGRILLSFIGMDGYLSFLGDNYYVAGEWFFGMIVILYLLYPLTAKVFSFVKLRIPIEIALIALTYVMYHTDFSPVMPSRSIVTCLLAFWTGMLVITIYRKLINIPSFVVFLAVSLLLLYFPFNRWEKLTIYFEDALAVALFVVVANIVERFPKIPGLSQWANYTSRISLQMLLMQHLMVLKVLSNFAGMTIGRKTEIGLFLLTVFVVYLTSDMLYIVTNEVLKRVSKWNESISSRRKSE